MSRLLYTRDRLAGLYLDLVKRAVLGLLSDPPVPLGWASDGVWRDDVRKIAPAWAAGVLSMLGWERLSALGDCAVQAVTEDVPGDFAEIGVWRGGGVILLRAVLSAYGITDRAVWAADSFQGLPADAGPDVTPADRVLLTASEDQVRRSISLYGLLDQVQFLPGWFDATLPAAPVRELSLLHLDGDLYESQRCALENLYPKLSPGGFCIVDDIHFSGVERAVREYRDREGITAEMHETGWYAVWWRKEVR